MESLAIAGESDASSLESFGGLSYRNSYADREDFRVVFVLGGPGKQEAAVCCVMQCDVPKRLKTR